MLLRGKFGCLPVVRHGRLCGILTEADFLRLTLQPLEAADIDEGPISRKSLDPLHNLTAMPIIHPVIQNALEALFDGAPISPGMALAISALPEVETPGLLLAARTVRRATRGSKVHRCAILNAKSGRCSEDCAFCAQSGHYATAAPVTPLLSEETIVAAGEAAAQAGAHCFSIVTSGLRLPPAELATVCAAVARLRQRTNLELAASLGLLSDADAAQLRAAGLTRYHHNLETSASYFPRICSTHNYAEDVATVRRAKDYGLEVCCGGIIGLGEGWAERIELALTLRELEVERIPLNFLLPIPATPLEAQPLLSPHDALKTIALFRLLLPQAGITIAGGRSRILGDYQSWIFLAGADGCMIGNYLTTPGRDLAADAVMLEAGTWI